MRGHGTEGIRFVTADVLIPAGEHELALRGREVIGVAADVRLILDVVLGIDVLPRRLLHKRNILLTVVPGQIKERAVFILDLVFFTEIVHKDMSASTIIAITAPAPTSCIIRIVYRIIAIGVIVCLRLIRGRKTGVGALDIAVQLDIVFRFGKEVVIGLDRLILHKARSVVGSGRRLTGQRFDHIMDGLCRRVTGISIERNVFVGHNVDIHQHLIERGTVLRFPSIRRIAVDGDREVILDVLTVQRRDRLIDRTVSIITERQRVLITITIYIDNRGVIRGNRLCIIDAADMETLILG